MNNMDADVASIIKRIETLESVFGKILDIMCRIDRLEFDYKESQDFSKWLVEHKEKITRLDRIASGIERVIGKANEKDS